MSSEKSSLPGRQPVVKPVIADPRGSARSAATAASSAASLPTPPQGEVSSQIASGGAPAAVNSPQNPVRGHVALADAVDSVLDHLGDLSEATYMPQDKRVYETDVATVALARRNGRVLLALLDVWQSAVGEHAADEVGVKVYNSLKSAADILLHVDYPPKA